MLTSKKDFSSHSAIPHCEVLSLSKTNSCRKITVTPFQNIFLHNSCRVSSSFEFIMRVFSSNEFVCCRHKTVNGVPRNLLCSQASVLKGFSCKNKRTSERDAAIMAAFTPASKNEKLDFRFAMDEIDAKDIETLVNQAFALEHDGGELSFRKPGPTIAYEEVETDLLSNGKSRWVVLETQPPEELVIAAARFVLDSERRVGVVDVLCATAEGDIVLQRSRLTMLIRKLESVVWSHHYGALIIEVSSWRTDVQDMLSEMGYEDRGGRCWPEESVHLLTKHTMILGFRKNAPSALTSANREYSMLHTSSSSASTAHTAPTAPTAPAPTAASALASALMDLDLDSPTLSRPHLTPVGPAADGVVPMMATLDLDEDSALGAFIDSLPLTSGEPGATGNPAMEALMNDLFRALHTENTHLG
jgi:hypothetical protein